MRNFIERIVVQTGGSRLAFDTKEAVRPSLIGKFEVFVFKIVQNEQHMIKHFEFNVNLIEGTTYQFS